MRKKVGLIKRIFTLLLVVLMSINSFAAIVSDNDGSAFITKAEFDALKSSFQAQIDTYNHSIDSKIDGAIASYLAGVSISSLYYGDLLLDNCSKFRIENNAQLGESERKLPDIDMRIDLENYRRYPEGSSIWFWVIVDYIDIYSRAHNRMKKNIVDVVNATNHDIHIAENDTSTARHYIFKGIIDDWLESYQLVWFGQTEDNWGGLNQASSKVKFYNAFSFNLGSGYRTQAQLESSTTWEMQLKYVTQWGTQNCTYNLKSMRLNTQSSGSNVVVPYVSGWQSSNMIEVNVPGWNNTFNATAYTDKISSQNLSSNCTVTNNTTWVKFDQTTTNPPEVYGRTSSKVELLNTSPTSTTQLTRELNGVGRVANLPCVDVYLAPNKLTAVFAKTTYTQSNYLTMRDGFPLYYAEKGTKCFWHPKFSQMTVGGVAKSLSSNKINIKLAYAPFQDQLECNGKYINKEHEASGTWTTWQTKTDGTADISFTMPEDGWIYAKWYPESLTGADLSSQNWMVELDGTNSDNFSYNTIG